MALRKWSNLVPSSEFRCFVLNTVLVGEPHKPGSCAHHCCVSAACQRDDSQFYDFLVEDKGPLAAAIQDFYATNVLSLPP